MPVVIVHGLPSNISQKKLKSIESNIVAIAIGEHYMAVTSKKTMTVLFPKDLMTKGTVTEIIIYVRSGTFGTLKNEARNMFAQAMVEAVKAFYPRTMVECFIDPYTRADGFYHSPASD